MQTLVIALGSLVLYLIAYHTYGRWLARKIFRLDPHAKVPSIELEDGEDYVPTQKGVVFGHHFTSIAGTGPIVGPALAVIWGWVPALLWVLFGSILIGAVHDFGALVISMRHRGQTVGDIAGRVLSPRARILFLSILFMALTIVLAIFGLVIAAVFKMYPAAIFPCLVQTPIAVVIGVWLHRKGANILVPSIIALAVMYLTVAYGNVGFLGAFNTSLAAWPTIVWVAVLLIYSYVASVLPVWSLLQPRDFINSLQLLSALGLIVVGLMVAAFMGGAPIDDTATRPALAIAAEAYRPTGHGAPWIFPFLFVTIACGAVSGFHCLVSSGTSSKQLKSETDAQFVGYGSMLTEGFLAVLVILACVAGLGLGIPELVNGKATGAMLTGADAYHARYGTWAGSAGLGPKVGAFVDGSANFIKALGISPDFAVALMGVFVASFAATTLDTACRLQRYVTQELGRAVKIKQLTNKHLATIFAILIAGLIAALPSSTAPISIGEALSGDVSAVEITAAWTPAQVEVIDNIEKSGGGLAGATIWLNNFSGKGGLLLWPLFGATNQLLGGLAFLVILFWMHRRNIPNWFILAPATFMLLLPASAMLLQLFVGEEAWLTGEAPNYLLSAFGLATIGLEIWILFEAFAAWPKVRGILEESADAAESLPPCLDLPPEC
jgi:carbon starvation protein